MCHTEVPICSSSSLSRQNQCGNSKFFVDLNGPRSTCTNNGLSRSVRVSYIYAVYSGKFDLPGRLMCAASLFKEVKKELC